MTRIIMIGQVVFFILVGALLAERQIEITRVSTMAAVYRELPLKTLGEIQI